MSAESYKAKGNIYFNEKDYESAVKEYSEAISRNSRNAVYYTNRALCYLKLGKYDNVISDCNLAIGIDTKSVKGHYMLGQALTEKANFDSAVSHLQIAYELSITDKVTKVNFSGEIIQALLSARKKKWESENQRRHKDETEFLKYIKGLINAEREKQLQKVIQNKNSFGSTFSKLVNLHPTEIQDKLDQINKIHDEKLSQIEQVFAQSEENHHGPKEIPDYFLDKISFNIMHDPVITPSGITYERAHLKEHFKKIGQFDPLSRLECRESDLYPNLALKEAIEDYLSKNGWAADY
ncbi:STIP1 homology and U box-containing protein 1-like protein [Glomus cerebriforme]|uniref:E3 ubiquitin-protein ligase CHIP n=1 Tax=Glomus cerebriforme TaxID=658196 RepID=A0A397TAJ5_9GLOM|nr:STIP1 homology and U box-containing protein 1-like protein [Glomus cerebriforme]